MVMCACVARCLGSNPVRSIFFFLFFFFYLCGMCETRFWGSNLWNAVAAMGKKKKNNQKKKKKKKKTLLLFFFSPTAMFWGRGKEMRGGVIR